MRWFLRLSVLWWSLACSGLFPQGAQEDQGDEAADALLREDFTGAEAILQRRLREDPRDARSWRLLGDVNLIRGQRFQERWKENLGWAIDAYRSSVQNDPASCAAWGRLATSLAAAAENPATAVPRATLDALPLSKGWAACSSAALLEIEWLRRPTEAELASADIYLTGDPSPVERMAAAAPWMSEAAKRLALGGLEWKPTFTRPEVGSGTPLALLDLPVTGASVGGSEPRRFTWPEWVSVSRVAGKQAVYLDRRFPATVAEVAITRAPGCPGSKWELEGIDRIPVGQCVRGPHDRRASELFDPKILKPAGVAHYHEPSVRLAGIPWESVAEKSVTCSAGAIGRLLIDTPSCQVSYDRAIAQTRSVPVASGLAASSPEHAARMVDIARGERLVGEAAPHLARGEVAVGLPFAMFQWTQPDLTGCKGRGVYAKLEIVDGGLEFACVLHGWSYRFRELALVELAPSG